MKKFLFMILVLCVGFVHAQEGKVLAPGVMRPGPGMRPSGPMMRPKDVPMRPVGPLKDDGKATHRLKYQGGEGSLDFMLKDYASLTARTLLIDPEKIQPQLKKGTVVLESEGFLTLTEYLQAIERVLRMHKIAILPIGEKFLKVVPLDAARTSGMGIDDEKTGLLAEEGKWVSQFISLKHIDVNEGETAITPFIHPGTGKIFKFESSNSLLVTDTQDNINRVLQIIKRVDQPIEVREVTNVRQIKFVKATDIKKHIDDLVTSSLQDQQKKNTQSVSTKTTGSPGYKKRNIPGVIRAPSPLPRSVVSTDSSVSEAERGIIRGRVQVVADDRTGTLIIITKPENMKFFDQIIDVLDVSSDPDVIVKVIPLNYADVEEVEKMINELIGLTAKSSKDGSKVSSGVAAKSGDDKSSALQEFVKRRDSKTQQGSSSASSKVGQLSSDNIKILANKRTNSLVVMASKGDLKALEELVASMDMKLSQVLIEAVILEIGLDESVKSGVDWVQRSMIAFDESSGAKEPLFAFAGGGGGGTLSPLDTLGLTETSALASALPTGGGLNYYFTHFGLNLDAIVSLAASDSRTEIISKPVIVTHENEEAKIESSEDKYFYKGKRWVSTGTSSGTYEDDVDLKSITTSLTVTPHINEEQMVEMEIVQKIEELGPPQTIGDNDWPTTLKRELAARVAVRNGETIILGGFVKQEKTTVDRGIPILKDIPVLGWFFGSTSEESGRSELVVFMTPYVMDTDDEIMGESRRRREALEAGDLWEQGWSNSKLANPTKDQIKAQKQADKEARQQAELDARGREEYDRNPKGKTGSGSKKGIIPFIRTKPRKGEEQPFDAADYPEEVSNVLKTGAETGSGENPLSGLDPELAEFIKRQEKRWDRKIKAADQEVEKEMK